MTKLTFFGLLGTGLYLTFLFAFSVASHESFVGMPPNAWGDFLAGAFGPLAIFWLVLGFFQQGAELRNSVETLKLQADELSQSVKQQRELVAVTRESFTHEREVLQLEIAEKERAQLPKFLISCSRSDSGQISIGDPLQGNSVQCALSVTNAGGAVKNFSLAIQTKVGKKVIFQQTYLDTGQKLEGQINSVASFNFMAKISFLISYSTLSGVRHEETFTGFPGDRRIGTDTPFNIDRVSGP